MNTYIKSAVLLCYCLFTSVSVQSQNWPTYSGTGAQNEDPVFDKSSVWHKNMELIKPVDFAGSYVEEMIQTGKIKYKVNNVDVSGQFVISSTGTTDFTGLAEDETHFLNVPRIQVFNVTDPRNSSLALEIFLKNDPLHANDNDVMNFSNKNTYYTFKNTAIWTDGNTPGHTYLAANVNERTGVKVSSTSEIYSRVIIIDLTVALTRVQGEATNQLIIGDSKARNSTYLKGASLTKFSDVYIGYIPRDDENFKTFGFNIMTGGEANYGVCQFHTMTCDMKSSVLAISPIGVSKYGCTPVEVSTGVWVEDCDLYKTYVDCYMMNTIPGHANIGSSSAFVNPTRITTSDGKPVCVDITIGSKTYSLNPHESHAHLMKVMKDTTVGSDTWTIPDADLFEENAFMLNVASYGYTREHLDSKNEKLGMGGAAIFKINTSSGLNAAVVNQLQMWEYNDDRTQPQNQKYNPVISNTVWSSTSISFQ